MAASPILPRNNADVTGQQRRVKGAINEFSRRMRKVRAGMLKILADQQYQVITLNSFGINATTYQFLLDDSVLSRIDLEIAYLIDELMDEGTPQTNWFVKGYAEPAYVNGLAMTHANLSVQSASYAASRPTLESVLMSPAYKSRIGLLRARVFNEMKGLSDTMKGDLSATLSRGMAAGQNPRKIAKDIEQRVGVSTSRANRIAQTEIVGAMRTARRAEAQQAQTELGIMSKMMHLSALKPTTRPSHRARHAHLYTIQEVADWYEIVPNSISCFCSQVEILVDEKGNPLSPGIIERAKRKLGQ